MSVTRPDKKVYLEIKKLQKRRGLFYGTKKIDGDGQALQKREGIPPKMEPAGFWIRLVAVIIDGIILTILSGSVGHLARTIGLSRKLGVKPLVVPKNFVLDGKVDPEMMNLLLESLFGAMVLGLAISLFIGFFYFGWFYKNKGGSPGKLLVGLRVENFETKENIGYFGAFFREYIGKLISGLVTLSLGYIMAALGQTKAIHDMIVEQNCSTKKCASGKLWVG